jgi:hypothetical protein
MAKGKETGAHLAALLFLKQFSLFPARVFSTLCLSGGAVSMSYPALSEATGK